MADRLAWVDSELSEVRLEAQDLWIRLSAASVERLDTDGGERPRSGWSSGLSLQLVHAEVEDQQPPLIGRIQAARMELGGRACAWLDLSVTDHPVACRLELQLAHGARLQCRARGLRIWAAPELPWRESAAC